jgi:hypothetical protein
MLDSPQVGKKRGRPLGVRDEPLPETFDVIEPAELEAAAERFAVPLPEAERIAAEVAREQLPFHTNLLVFARKRLTSELRDYLHALYNEEIRGRFRTCAKCAAVHSTIEHAVVHRRLHMMLESSDERVAARVADAIDRVLFPEESESVGAILAPEERKQLVERLKR